MGVVYHNPSGHADAEAGWQTTFRVEGALDGPIISDCHRQLEAFLGYYRWLHET